MRWIAFVLVAVSLLSPAARAAESAAARVDAPEAPPSAPPSAPLKVALSPFVPFVFVEEGARPRGYSVELWERIADELELSYEYVIADGVAEKLALLKAGEADLAVGGITLTAERERSVDFTYPTLTAGLSILTKPAPAPGLFESVKGAFSRTRVSILIGFVLLIVIAGHLMWLAEHGKDAFSDKYIPGVLEGMYWAVVTASTVGYGDKAPAKWAGRFLAMLVIVVSLPLFALFTAELTSALTIEEIQSQIRGPSDLEESEPASSAAPRARTGRARAGSRSSNTTTRRSCTPRSSPARWTRSSTTRRTSPTSRNTRGAGRCTSWASLSSSRSSASPSPRTARSPSASTASCSSCRRAASSRAST